MLSVVVDLAISPEEYQRYYLSPHISVRARSIDGRSISFPASVLQHCVSYNGIYGRFRIEFSSQGKFTSVSRLG